MLSRIKVHKNSLFQIISASAKFFFTNEKKLQISDPAPKEWSNQKEIQALSNINRGLFIEIKCFIFFFGHSLCARAEICQMFSLVKKNMYSAII